MTTETASFDKLKEWLDNVAIAIEHAGEPDLQIIVSFLSSPDLAYRVVDLLSEI